MCEDELTLGRVLRCLQTFIAEIMSSGSSTKNIAIVNYNYTASSFFIFNAFSQVLIEVSPRKGQFYCVFIAHKPKLAAFLNGCKSCEDMPLFYLHLFLLQYYFELCFTLKNYRMLIRKA